MVLDRTRAWGKKGNPHRGSAFTAVPRPRAGSPGEGWNPSRVLGSSGRWPLAHERRAARAHARLQWQWRPPSARGGGISTWIAAPSHRGRQETASAALLQVPREPPERVEREQRWLRWRGVAHEARARRWSTLMSEVRALAARPTHGWDGATAAALSPGGARRRGGAARPWTRCHLERSARVRDCARGDGGAMADGCAACRPTGQGGSASASADETRARVWAQHEHSESIITRARELA